MNQVCRVTSELNAFEIRQALLESEHEEREEFLLDRYELALKELLAGRKLQARGKSFSLFEDIDQANDQYIGNLFDNGISVWDEFVNNRLPVESVIEVKKYAGHLAKNYIDLSFGADL